MNIETFFRIAGRGFIEPFPYLIVAAVLLLTYKILHDWITEYDDRALLKQGNKAVAITRAGAYLGVVFAATGSLINTDERTYWEGVGIFALDGIIAIGVLTAAVFLFDSVIVRNVKNSTYIADGNFAVGFLEACAYISLGLITCAAFSGNGQEFFPGIGSAMLFSFIGMATLALVYKAYCWAWMRFKKRDVDALVASGNVPAAVDAGTLLIAVSITLWFSISGDFTGWASDLASYALAVLSSTLIIPFGRLAAVWLLANKLDPEGADKHQGNLSKSLIVGLVSIAIGFMLGIIQFM
jgi:uncharacterized membrane protein YjfL (UPF0719 family)